MIFISLLSGFCLVLFFIMLKYSKSKCNKEIKAIYVKSNLYIVGKGGPQYAPVFKYSFNGKDYEQQTFQTFSKKHIKNFISGEKYSIFINEEKPTKFIISKKSKNGDIIICSFGIFLIILGILCIFIKT